MSQATQKCLRKLFAHFEFAIDADAHSRCSILSSCTTTLWNVKSFVARSKGVDGVNMCMCVCARVCLLGNSANYYVQLKVFYATHTSHFTSHYFFMQIRVNLLLVYIFIFIPLVPHSVIVQNQALWCAKCAFCGRSQYSHLVSRSHFHIVLCNLNWLATTECRV